MAPRAGYRDQVERKHLGAFERVAGVEERTVGSPTAAASFPGALAPHIERVGFELVER